jgi:hypothetical protein
MWACVALRAEDLLVWKWPGLPGFQPTDISGYHLYLNRDFASDPRNTPEELDTWESVGEIGSVDQMYPIPKPSCGLTWGYKVTAFKNPSLVDVDPNQSFAESPPSEAFILEGPLCPQAMVEFTLERFSVKDTNDGMNWFPCLFCLPEIDPVLEVYGSGELVIMPAGQTFKVIFWSDEACGYGLFTGCVGDTYRRIDDGDTLNLNDENIFISGCFPASPGVPPTCATFNNSVPLVMKDGDWLAFSFELWEYDVAVDDSWCGTTMINDSSLDFGMTEWFPLRIEGTPVIFNPRSMLEWARADITQEFRNTGHDIETDDGKCTLTFHVQGNGITP